MEKTMGSVWVGLVLGCLPLLVWLLWWWNEVWYAVPLKLKCWRRSATSNGAKLPPGHMGFPLFGEMLTFLWYFKILRRPDEFIHSKRRKYGDGEGLYRTHLFGSPSIIACFPSFSKFALQSDDSFMLHWPNPDTIGRQSLGNSHGKAHARLRSYVVNAINRPNALSYIAAAVQPRLAAALQSWARKGRINANDETRRLTFENIGKMFASIEPAGPLLDTMDKLFDEVIKGIRAYPLNLPGTAFYNALQCRRRLEAIFRVELEKKKNGFNINNDLMDGLMEIIDDEGNKLSEQEVIDNIVSLVIGGYKSTALVQMWAIYYLAKFPEVLKKLREENIALRKKKQGDFITREDISKLKYTNKVVEETIRLANVSGFIFRLVTKDVEYKGYKIPKNWKVILWLRYLHTDPENFEDPMCFNPDRWNELVPRPIAYQVFGGGPRMCAGNMLARIQLALLLHHLSVGYKWELVNPDADLIYLPHPAPVDGVDVTFTAI